jgi:hypothetical protein
MSLQEKFLKLWHGPGSGQEIRHQTSPADAATLGEPLEGLPVDFSHGDVDAFQPSPGSFEALSDGVAIGGKQAYTEYRGDDATREAVAQRLAAFTGAPVDGRDGPIITPGTQRSRFLSVASTVSRRQGCDGTAGLLCQSQDRRVFRGSIFADPPRLSGSAGRRGPLPRSAGSCLQGRRGKSSSFPTRTIPQAPCISLERIDRIAELAARHGAMVIVDQLYSRPIYGDAQYERESSADWSREGPDGHPRRDRSVAIDWEWQPCWPHYKPARVAKAGEFDVNVDIRALTGDISQ